MKNIFNKKACGMVLIASVAMMASANALACKKYDIPCKAREAANRAKDAANRARQEAENVAEQAASSKAAAAAAAAAATAAAATQAANAAQAAAAQTAREAAPMTMAEINIVKSNAQTAYSASTGAVANGYSISVNAVNSAINDALRGLLLAAGKTAVDKNKTVLINLKRNMTYLDVEGKAALNRLVKTVGSKNFDAKASADLKLLGSKLGLLANTANQNIPYNLTHSSWGISIDVSAAAGLGGGVSYALAMNTFPEPNGSYRGAFIESGGVSAGAANVGGGISIGIFWSPGPADQQTGPSIGFDWEIAGALPPSNPTALPTGAGISVALSWGLPTSSSPMSALNAAAAAIPGISVAYSDGLAIKMGALSAGYSQVVAGFPF